MYETVTSRVSRLISGSINAIIDKAEGISPEIVMKETIREVDATIDEVKVLLGKETVVQKTTQNQIANEKEKYSKLSEQIDIAMKENREDLAKSAISRQMDIETQFPILEESLVSITQNIEKLENYIDALNAKKREMQKELEEFQQFNDEKDLHININSNIEKAEDAFNRVNRGLKSKLLNDDDMKLAELDKLTRENRISERLESLKALKN